VIFAASYHEIAELDYYTMPKLGSILILIAFGSVADSTAIAATLSGELTPIPQGAVVNLTTEGPLDWVHWGLYTETSLDRKAGVAPLISDFALVGAPNGFAYADNYNGYSWSDGTPTASVTNTTTGVWAYSLPAMGSGFQVTAPADTTLRTLKVYVGAYAARGRFEAFLSDSNATAYTDTSLVNQMGNGPSGIYSITYAAQSAGQTLTVRWTLVQTFRAGANVTLQAAALTAAGVNNPPIVMITSPVANATVAAGSDIMIDANATDTDGNVTLVEFFQGTTKIGEAASSPFRFTWTNAPPGHYILTAKATDNGSATTTSGPVEIFVITTGGSLAGNTALPPSDVDLAAEGTADWAHWGLISSNSFDHRACVPQQISNFTKLGANKPERYADNFTAYSWSDGTPIASTNGTKTGVFTYGLTNGFLLTVPADTSTRTLKVYVGLYGAQGDFQAYLSDFSAPAYTDMSLGSVFGNAYAVYTLNYAAASAGQTLTIKYTPKTLYDGDFGNVTLQAATLSGGSAPTTNSPRTVSIISPTDNATFAAPANITVVAVSDCDPTISKVEFFAGATKLGETTNVPYSLVWSNVAAGSYSLTAVATDTSGAVATSNPLNFTVTSVTLFNPVLSGDQFGISFTTELNRIYTLQRTLTLNPMGWQVVTNVVGDGKVKSVIDSIATSAQQFYRVKTQ
jgi:Big-like domain-containing protein